LRGAAYKDRSDPATSALGRKKTDAAIRARAAVTYQSTLTGNKDTLFGRPDFQAWAELLPARDGNLRPTRRHYEVVDAKLAQTAKTRAVLQIAFYSRLLARLPGTEPRWMHLALGDREPFQVHIVLGLRQGEKRAFEELVAFITKRRAVNPGLHVYHYHHYEPTSVDHLTELHGTRQEAVGRLTGRFATREDEVDDLLRLGCSSICTGSSGKACRPWVESYSIKRLEPLCGYDR
jgi:predicted RecB family nuclease